MISRHASSARGTDPRQSARVGTAVLPTFGHEMSRIVFLDEAGRPSEVSLDRAAEFRFERATPIRVPKSFRGKRGMVGRAYFSTCGKAVVFDSRNEMENVLLLDFDPEVVDIVGQPFRIETPEWSHVPDFFARRRDGSAQVLDVKPEAEQDAPDNQLLFTRMDAVCDDLGWGYAVLPEVPEPLRRNVMLLAGHRRQPFDHGGLGRAIVDACATPTTIADLDRLHPVTAIVRPLVLHLLWRRVLECDLEARVLDRDTQVWTAEGFLRGL